MLWCHELKGLCILLYLSKSVLRNLRIKMYCRGCCYLQVCCLAIAQPQELLLQRRRHVRALKAVRVGLLPGIPQLLRLFRQDPLSIKGSILGYLLRWRMQGACRMHARQHRGATFWMRSSRMSLSLEVPAAACCRLPCFPFFSSLEGASASTVLLQHAHHMSSRDWSTVAYALSTLRALQEVRIALQLEVSINEVTP